MLIENLLNEEQLNALTNEVLNSSFPWYWMNSAISKEFEILTKHEYFSFVHIVYDKGKIVSDIFPKVQNIIKNFENFSGTKIKSIHRIQINMLLKVDFSEYDERYSIHADIESDKHISLVYYLNDSDGNTKLFDSERKNVLFECEPKKGTCIFFNSSQWHSATPPKRNSRRVVLNMILEKNDE